MKIEPPLKDWQLILILAAALLVFAIAHLLPAPPLSEICARAVQLPLEEISKDIARACGLRLD